VDASGTAPEAEKADEERVIEEQASNIATRIIASYTYDVKRIRIVVYA
jgi:hypothetical protein